VRYGSGAQATVVGLAIDRDVVLHRASADDVPLARPAADLPAGTQMFSIGGDPVAFFDLDILIREGAAAAAGRAQAS
jgi:hypothetical protein